jgi:hypothetical protein
MSLAETGGHPGQLKCYRTFREEVWPGTAFLATPTVNLGLSEPLPCASLVAIHASSIHK